jgi:hypothetical protein
MLGRASRCYCSEFVTGSHTGISLWQGLRAGAIIVASGPFPVEMGVGLPKKRDECPVYRDRIREVANVTD